MAVQSNQRNRRITVVVAGDSGTGKSSLIATAVSEKCPSEAGHVLPPKHLPADFFPEHVPITIIDTPSGPENIKKRERAEAFRLADVVVLTCSWDRLYTFDSLRSYWLPELCRLKVKVPIIIAGCKAELMDEFGLEQIKLAMSEEAFVEVDGRIECSAYHNILVLDVFKNALRSAFYPIAPLYDRKNKKFKRQFICGLRRIFYLCDLDQDGALNDAELNESQVTSSNAPLKSSEIVSLKRAVQDEFPERVDDRGLPMEGVNERGLTMEGFLFHYESAFLNKRFDLVWSILHKFGYNNDVRLAADVLPSFKRAPDQSVELTNGALDYLRRIFSLFYKELEGVISAADTVRLFPTSPDCPWSESPYMGAASANVLGGLTHDGFLSQWVLMTLLEPAKTVEYLTYIMFKDEDPASHVRLTRKRLTDRKERQSERTVYQCFVFGPKKAGKTALLDGFLGRPFSDTSIPNNEERYAVNVVDGTEGIQKFLVLREIPEAKVKNLLSDKESLAACDVALFVYDSTDESSFKKTAKLLEEVARHGEDTGYGVPSMIVSAKDDLDSYTKSIKDSTRLSQDMGIDAPVPLSAKRGNLSDLFQRIVTTAEQPHLNIPETEAGRSTKQYPHLVNPSVLADSVGAADWHYRIGCFSLVWDLFIRRE